MTSALAELPQVAPVASVAVQPKARADRRAICSLILALLLWPSLVSPSYAPTPQLDPSWQEVLIHAHAQGWQFGRDIIFTWGPWGYLQSQFHLGDTLATSKLLWEILGKLLVAVGMVAITRRLGVVQQACFCIACILFCHVLPDATYLLLISLIVVACLMRSDSPRWQLAVSIAALAFLSQFKFTYLMVAVAGLGAAASLRVWRRDVAGAGKLLAGFSLAFGVFWMAAGQHPQNMLAYLRMSWEISQGYASAMNIEETPRVFKAGVAVLGMVAVFLAQVVRRHSDRAMACFCALYLAAAWFVAWKHGFIRADGHVLGFFTFTAMISMALPGLLLATRRWHWFQAAPLVCLWGMHQAGHVLTDFPQVAVGRMATNCKWMLAAHTQPERWEQELEAARLACPAPEIVKRVGAASVDVFNYEQGIALIHGLNYRPRPIIQSYSAYTPRLALENLRFFESPRAPEFILWKHITIDGRYPTIDDGAILAALPRRYEPVMSEGDFLLLRKKESPQPSPVAKTVLWEREVTLGEDIVLPATLDQPLWLQAELPLNLRGRLRNITYKPPLLHLIVTDHNGREQTYRLVPALARDGFLLHPLLETQGELTAFVHARASRPLRSIRLQALGKQARFWGPPVLKLSAMSDLPLVPSKPLQAFEDEGVAELTPDRVRCDFQHVFFRIGLQKAVQVHAAGEVEFTTPPRATEFVAVFGIREEAHQGAEHTDGVEFQVEGHWSDGRQEVLWEQLLTPHETAAHRGQQTLRLTLPPDPPARLVLRTRPGPSLVSNWDWSYWSGIKFVR